MVLDDVDMSTTRSTASKNADAVVHGVDVSPIPLAGTAGRVVLTRADPYLRVGEAAQRVRLSKETLQNAAWRSRNGLPTLRAGTRLVFAVDDLDAWLRRNL
jgi:excisionase family DNA binding protein